MITEVLLILPLYVIKAMADVENMLNDDDFFRDIVDTPKEGIGQHKKRECLKSIINKGKAHLLGHKWTHERIIVKNKISTTDPLLFKMTFRFY